VCVCVPVSAWLRVCLPVRVSLRAQVIDVMEQGPGVGGGAKKGRRGRRRDYTLDVYARHLLSR
jgi:hypothetical protein